MAALHNKHSRTTIYVREISQNAHDTRCEETESVNLGNNPFLQSIFAEVTRLRVVGLIIRLVTGDDFHLGEWSIHKGSPLAIASRTGAMKENMWNIGSGEDSHPLDKFWEDRFLIYPDKPKSGPTRTSKGVSVPDEQDLKAHSSDPTGESQKPIFSLKGLKGTYNSFGGGVGSCPGRIFARQEVLCTLAVLVLECDIELLVPPNWEPKMNYK